MNNNRGEGSTEHSVSQNACSGTDGKRGTGLEKALWHSHSNRHFRHDIYQPAGSQRERRKNGRSLEVNTVV